MREETRGEEPDRAIWLYKVGEGANESAAERFKRELSELIKEKNTAPEQEDEARPSPLRHSPRRPSPPPACTPPAPPLPPVALHHLERAALACPQVRLGVPGWKDRYYDAKFPGVDDAGRREVAAAYVEGLQWVMRYYYDGCASWKWFYPYHYAPFAADLAAAIDPGQPADFELARPFRPFEQLMGVLPPRSAHALPEPLAQLMTDPGSEIADFYPEDFALDLNGKKFLWQAVVLLPFIDEARDYPRSPEITRDYPRLP